MLRVMNTAWRLLPVLLLAAVLMIGSGCSNSDNSNPGGPNYDQDAPMPESPANGANVSLEDLAASDEPLVLNWSDVAGATRYHLQLAVNDAFSETAMIVDTYVDSADGDLPSEYAPQLTKLAINSTHYWRLGAVMSDDSTGWGRSFKFKPTAEGIAVDEVLQGEILSDKTLQGNKKYLLRGGVFVGHEEASAQVVTLTIEAGCEIYGENATDGMLVIRRSGRIDAEGTAANPIVFSSDKTAGNRARGDWGGVILCGNAPLNTGDQAFGEGDTGPYGGNDPHSNSGTMKYVRIEFAGREISPDNELNGLALQGVGDATTIDYIQVHMNADDGIEFFGGTVRVKHIFLSAEADDNFDWTDGWEGRGQFLVCQQWSDDGDNGIEADNSADNNSDTPRSHPKLYNLTFIGNGDPNNSSAGMLLREGTAANIGNFVVMRFGKWGVDVDNQATFDNAWNDANSELSGELTLSSGAFFDSPSPFAFGETGSSDESGFPFTTEDFVTTLNQNLYSGVNPMLADPYDVSSPDFQPMAGSPILDGTWQAMDPSSVDSWFDAAEYIGAFDGANNWLAGWTRTPAN